MASRKSKKKSRKQKEVARKFKSTLSRYDPAGRMKFIHNPPGQLKMSEILMEFIEPYAVMARSEEDYRKLLSTALVAWNAALLPKAERREMVDSIINQAMPDAADDARLIIHEMIRHKDRHCAENNRAMLSYELTMTRDGPHVLVASTL